MNGNAEGEVPPTANTLNIREPTSPRIPLDNPNPSAVKPRMTLYFIGGTCRAGKSLLARRLAKQLNISYFSLDYLFLALHPAFPQLGIRQNDPDDIKARRLWKFQKEVMGFMLLDKLDIVVEGVTVLPWQMASFKRKYGKQVHAVFLGYADATIEGKVADISANHGHPGDWLENKTDGYKSRVVSGNIARSERYRQGCAKYGLKYIETSHNFTAAHAQALECLIKGE